MGDRLPTGWMQAGACRGLVEFQHYAYSELAEDKRKAKKLCTTCEVQTDCLAYALLTREPHGVWGGRTSDERRKIVKYGGAIADFNDNLRHQLFKNEPEPEPVSSDPTTWDWSI